ncbi:hypothetical protein V9T40_010666 [Parthenolecanium corni]|uniref:Uncharacterized protein n=1 Tax=Parthenolecanium corni TaxID=536013 RepID=A0AAN9XYT0_9HEMI
MPPSTQPTPRDKSPYPRRQKKYSGATRRDDNQVVSRILRAGDLFKSRHFRERAVVAAGVAAVVDYVKWAYG